MAPNLLYSIYSYCFSNLSIWNFNHTVTEINLLVSDFINDRLDIDSIIIAYIDKQFENDNFKVETK